MSVFLQGNFGSILSMPLLWFSTLDRSLAVDIASTSTELLAAVLGISITVIAIIVELAANRYSHRISSLFVREPVNIAVLSFFVVASLFSVWISLTLTAKVENPVLLNAGLFINLVMLTLALAILLPYFVYVMSFLSPMSIIRKIQGTAMNSIHQIKDESVAKSQLKLISAIDELQDIARRSLELCDRAVEMESINSLLNLTLDYQSLIPDIESKSINWFQIQGVVKQDPDFVSINETSLSNIVSEKIWVEVKVLRQYLDLVGSSNPASRDTTYLIAINTRKIAIESVKHRPGLELTNLCIRCFNSYLRGTINKKDARTGYYIMNQYRMLAEDVLDISKFDVARDIAGYIHFYGLLGFQQGLPFLLEVAAEDIAQLASRSIGHHEKLLDDLLDLLLNLDQDLKEEFQSESLLGVRRAQVKLATRFMIDGDEERFTRICDDLKTEKLQRIEQLLDSLQADNSREYWEFTDRGVNYNYLPDNQKKFLKNIASRVQS